MKISVAASILNEAAERCRLRVVCDENYGVFTHIPGSRFGACYAIQLACEARGLMRGHTSASRTFEARVPQFGGRVDDTYYWDLSSLRVQCLKAAALDAL